MATFKVKTFNELSGKGQNGDIAIIERADINGNKGFSFRDASGWALPFVQVETLGANLMTTNTSQSVSAAKTFQGEVVVNDDFSVIGATDIDLGFTGNLTVDAGNEAGSKVTIDNVEDIELSADEEIGINADSSVTINSDLVSIASSASTFNFGNLGGGPVNYGLEWEGTQGTKTLSINAYTGGSGNAEFSVSSEDSSSSFWGSDSVTGVLSVSSSQVVKSAFNNITDGTEFTSTVSNSGVDLRAINGSGDISQITLTPQLLLISLVLASELKISGLGVYADNAAALVGGLTTDMVYKTATGELRIVV